MFASLGFQPKELLNEKQTVRGPEGVATHLETHSKMMTGPGLEPKGPDFWARLVPLVLCILPKSEAAQKESEYHTRLQVLQFWPVWGRPICRASL